MKFRGKIHLIESLLPDIAIIQECEHISKITAGASESIWVGDNEHKGLGIFTYTNKPIQIAEWYNPDFKYIVPLCYDGILLLAVWACNPKLSRYGYIEMLYQALLHYNDMIMNFDKIVIIGDFNSNAIWDNKHNKYGSHSAMVSFLAKHDVESVYHKLSNKCHGNENLPTFYLHRNQEKPYHIDYCFLSTELFSDHTKFEVGKTEEWIIYSDHVPIIVEI